MCQGGVTIFGQRQIARYAPVGTPLGLDIQGDQLNIAVFLVPCMKWLVQYSPLYSVQLHTYTGQVTFSKVPENTDMLNWSPCRQIHVPISLLGGNLHIIEFICMLHDMVFVWSWQKVSTRTLMNHSRWRKLISIWFHIWQYNGKRWYFLS